MTKLVVAEIPENADRDFSVEQKILGPEMEVRRFTYDGDDTSLVSACVDADVILTDYVPFTRAIIQELTRCKLISIAATGFSSIDVDAAAEAGISICAIDEYCTYEVADHTLTLMLALSRRLVEYHRQVQQEARWQFDSLSGIPRLQGLTLGIIGFGRIGKAVARRAAGFGLKIIAHDPYADMEAAASMDVAMCNLEELFATADIITLHCNLVPENRQFLDRSAFAGMKKKPILINVARGGLINEQHLISALDDGLISAAGLDVLAEESPDLESSPLVGRQNVILTPHVAFYSDASILESRAVSANNIRNFLDGNHGAVRQYVHHAIN